MGVDKDPITSLLKIPKKNGYSGKSLTEAVANGFFTVDRNWTVIYWNSSAEVLLEMPANKIMGKNLWNVFVGIIPINFYDVFHKAFLKDIPSHFTEYWAEKESWFDVVTYYCDGTLSVSFKNRSRELIFGQSAQPREQFRILNELYRFVTEVTNDCLWEWNLHTREIFWVDGGHKRVFGYPVENALVPQRFWESRIHPDDRVRIVTRLNQIINSGYNSDWEDEYRFQRANGEYAYVQDRGHFIREGDSPVTRMIGATLDITANKLNELKLVQERKSRQQQITNAVLAAQEKERADIGKELHDNLSQVLGATKMYIELAKKDDENRELCLHKSTMYINQVIDEIRRISKSLVVPGMAMGLVDSIGLVVDDMRLTQLLILDFSAENINEETIPEKLQLDIFRIVQEQLNNIVKHSKATHGSIRLTTAQQKIVLVISDNGIGADQSVLHNGVGIVNMRSRAERHGGNIIIKSEPGKGYKVRVIFPL